MLLAVTLACLALLRTSRSIEVNEEVEENSHSQIVNVSNLDTKPWVPLSSEDVPRSPFLSAEVHASSHRPRPTSPDHEAYIQQEIASMFLKLRAQYKNDGGAKDIAYLRSRESQQGDDLAPKHAQGSEAPVKFVYEHQPHDDDHDSQASADDEFQKYLQVYLPHLSNVAGPEEVASSYTSVGHGQQYATFETEEQQRLYPYHHTHQSLGNSIHAAHNTAGRHYESEYAVGKDLPSGEHLKFIQNHYKPHVGDDHGLYAAAVAESLAQKPLKFESDVKATRFTGAGSNRWINLPPAPLKSSSHPYTFHSPSLPADLHKSAGAPPVGKPYHPKRSQTIGLLKKALNMLAAFIPLGLFLAALTPNVIQINSTQPETPTRHRSMDGTIQDDLEIYPIFGLIEEYGYDSLDDPDCENRIFCEISRLGSHPNGNVIQKGFWQLTQNTPEEMADSLGLKEVFKAVRTNSCSIYNCKKKYDKLENSEGVKENTTEVTAASEILTEKSNITNQEKDKEEDKVKT